MEAAQLADDLKAQLEMAQKKLHDFQDEIVENSVTKEKDMFNFKRAQVSCFFFPFCLLAVFWTLKRLVFKSHWSVVCNFLLNSLSDKTGSVFFTENYPWKPIMVPTM